LQWDCDARPSHNIRIAEFDITYLAVGVIIYRYHEAAFGAGLTRMSTLRIAGIRDMRPFVQDRVLVDVA
jgi:hypothetical protein